MKPSEILQAMPGWDKAKGREILDSSAWAMPCRVGDAQCSIRFDAPAPEDVFSIDVTFDDVPHVLSIAKNPNFKELFSIWDNLSAIPSPILLALAEKECGGLFQLIENAVRRQLKIKGVASSKPDAVRTGRLVAPDGSTIAIFSLSDTPFLDEALGNMRFIDTAHPVIRELEFSAQLEYAAFAMPPQDAATLGVGDAVLLPELDPGASSWPVAVVVEGRLAATKEAGLAVWKDDGRVRIVAPAPVKVRFAELAEFAAGGAFFGDTRPLAENTPLALVQGGRIVAKGRLEKVASQNAFVADEIGG